MKIAIIKPDHIGDLILSSPAIRAISAEHSDAVLFVAPTTAGLARTLFPSLEIRTISFPHLTKGSSGEADLPDLNSFHAAAILRRDAVISPQWARTQIRHFVMFEDLADTHQTVLDFSVAREFSPSYDIDSLFYNGSEDSVAAKSERDPAVIGLSIGSGFYANSWPLGRWVELGRRLHDAGRSVRIISGPVEKSSAEIIASLVPESELIIGTNDYKAFFNQISELDLVIASDGGTAHLCSLQSPVLSLFGPSPLWRFCPNGRHNRVISKQMLCSPCCQYAATLVNGCLSVECMAGIPPREVFATAIHDRVLLAPGSVRSLGAGLRVFHGPSSRDRKTALHAREREAFVWSHF